MKDVVNERNSKRIRVRLFDEITGDPVLPATLEWRVDCRTTGEALKDWTQAYIQPVVDDLGALVEYRSDIPIPASVNAIQNDANRQERRRVLIVADRGLETEWSTEVEYYVRNLQGRN